MPQLTLTLDKNSHEALLQYAQSTHKTPEAIAEHIINEMMVHFLHGVSNGIDQALNVMRESKTPTTATPPVITSEPHTLESEASKISDVYKF